MLPDWIPSRSRVRSACVAAAVTVVCFCSEVLAGGDLQSHGPQLAVGIASKRDRDMVIPTLGWRLTFGPGQRLDRWARKLGTGLAFPIEGAFGVVTGDENEVEFQVVPMMRLVPACLRERTVVPFLEGGIGLMYTGLDNLGLGSNILFSDNLALGLLVRLPEKLGGRRLGVSYRYRHASHAGLWAESNSGLDTQYVWLGLE